MCILKTGQTFKRKKFNTSGLIYVLAATKAQPVLGALFSIQTRVFQKWGHKYLVRAFNSWLFWGQGRLHRIGTGTNSTHSSITRGGFSKKHSCQGDGYCHSDAEPPCYYLAFVTFWLHMTFCKFFFS